MVADLAVALREEAQAVNERRVLVLTGDPNATRTTTETIRTALDLDKQHVLRVGSPANATEYVSVHHTRELLGTTHPVVVYDAHAGLYPNAIGRIIGTVDGGGLFVLLTPPLDEWKTTRDAFHATLAVPPSTVDDVTTHFTTRFIKTLMTHRGIGIVDVDTGDVIRRGLTDPPPRPQPAPPSIPDTIAFPPAAYEACLTTDQVTTLKALESLRSPGHAVVVEADRGRGKSSVAGLAAGALAATGEDVHVSAPTETNTREFFARATALLKALNVLNRDETDAAPSKITTTTSGSIRFIPPAELPTTDPDVLFVDEAAAIAVPILTDTLRIGRIAFTTTIHGYEGAGRSFSVRFRDRLTQTDLNVIDSTLTEPIRYAPGDPIETWAFRALLLDASPPVEQLIVDSQPTNVRYHSLDPPALLANEHLLREAFGLLVLAHYRTEPNDLARLLDAPNIETRALLYDGHVVSIALLAREGALPEALRHHMYEGGRIRGNMLPDILTSQLRDESAGTTTGLRIMRIATHAAVRSRGLGSHLLQAIHDEFDEVDWYGVGYGASPRLVSFWDDNGYGAIHLSTTRNERSGEHSVIMLRPCSPTGASLHDRHADWFVDRVSGMLPDTLRTVDPDIVISALTATTVTVPLDLSDPDWRLIASTAYGPGLFDVDPEPFRRLVIKHFADPIETLGFSQRTQRLLVTRVLQAKPWTEVAAALDYPSRSECMRALGRAFQPLVDTYGRDAAIAERDRFTG